MEQNARPAAAATISEATNTTAALALPPSLTGSLCEHCRPLGFVCTRFWWTQCSLCCHRTSLRDRCFSACFSAACPRTCKITSPLGSLILLIRWRRRADLLWDACGHPQPPASHRVRAGAGPSYDYQPGGGRSGCACAPAVLALPPPGLLSVPEVPCTVALVLVLLPPPVWAGCPQLPAALQLGERVGQLLAVSFPSPGSC